MTEYSVVDFNRAEPEFIEDVLNQQGEEGWRVVGTVNGTFVILEREEPSDSDF